jgi:molybdopterin biosynthesis enzyme
MNTAAQSRRDHALSGALTADQALARFFASHKCKALPPEDVALESAQGRVLATDFFSPHSLPSRPYAATDGYAIRYADLEINTAFRCSFEARVGKLTVQSIR